MQFSTGMFHYDPKERTFSQELSSLEPNNKTNIPAASNDQPTLAASAGQESTQPPDAVAETPTAMPTSDQMTVSGNGYTSVILANRQNSAAAGDTKDVFEASIPSGVDSLMAYFTWKAEAGSLDAFVTMPDGTKLTSKSKNDGLQLISNNNMLGFMLIKPVAGKWKFSIQDVKPVKDTLSYHLMVQYSQQSK